MKTSLEEISPVKKKLSVEIESHEIDGYFSDAYRELRKTAKVPGFRPNKIPKNILERRFGDQVAEDVTKRLISETFQKALDEVKVFPIGTPLLEKETLKQGQSFKYSATMDVRPEFELKDYLGIELEKEISSVSENDIETRLEQIREANGKIVSINEDRPVQKDDLAVIDYEGFEDSKPIEGVKASNYLLKVGNNSFYHKFEDALIGLKKEETSEFKVDFDDEYYNPKLAGKNVDFKVKILDIKKRELPELNDEFAQSLAADIKNIDELKEKLREIIGSQENNKTEADLKRKLLEKICESVDFELPQVLVESELNYAIENVKQNLARSGSNLEEAGISNEKLREDFIEDSKKRVKEMLILDKIATDNGIAVDESDLENGFRDMASAMGQPYEAVRNFYSSRNLENSMRERLLEQKTLNYLIENAKITEVKKEITNENAKSEKGDR